MKRIFCVLDMCLGCKSCEIACAVSHSQTKDIFKALKEAFRPKQRVSVQKSKQGPYPLQCRHCDQPACLLACMSAAISKDPEGRVIIDKERCVGCGMCMMSCPYGALIMDKDKKLSLKCDLCVNEEEPSSVSACPVKCLFYGEYEEFKAKIKYEIFNNRKLRCRS